VFSKGNDVLKCGKYSCGVQWDGSHELIDDANCEEGNREDELAGNGSCYMAWNALATQFSLM